MSSQPDSDKKHAGDAYPTDFARFVQERWVGGPATGAAAAKEMAGLVITGHLHSDALRLKKSLADLPIMKR